MAGGPTIKAVYEADTKKWSAGSVEASKALNQVDKDFKHLKEDVEKGASSSNWLTKLQKYAKENAKEQRSSGENALNKMLKDGAGNGLMEMLGVGGAAAGLEIVGKQLSEATSKAIKLKQEFKEGKITVGEMGEEIAKTIPVFGGWFETGRNIKELLTGEKAEIEEINKEAKETADRYQKQLETSILLHNVLDSMNKTVDDLNFQTSLIGLDEYHKQLLEIDRIEKDRINTATEKEKNDRITLQKKYDDEIAGLKTALENAENKATIAERYDGDRYTEEYIAKNAAALKSDTDYQNAKAALERKQAEKNAKLGTSNTKGLLGTTLDAENEAARKNAEALRKQAKKDSDKKYNDDIKKVADEKNKALVESNKTALEFQLKADDDAHAAKMANLKLHGKKEQAEIENIRYEAHKKIQDNMKKAAEAIGKNGIFNMNNVSIMKSLFGSDNAIKDGILAQVAEVRKGFIKESHEGSKASTTFSRFSFDTSSGGGTGMPALITIQKDAKKTQDNTLKAILDTNRILKNTPSPIWNTIN